MLSVGREYVKIAMAYICVIYAMFSSLIYFIVYYESIVKSINDARG